NDWRFWARAYSLMQNPEQVQVVLWMETEQARPALLEEITQSLNTQLRGRIASARIALRSDHAFLRHFEVASGT
ncbi:MAG: hypothetical protein KDD28_25105, partial [Phaeodactylibacter sp.]|nr:hypothetical protein [Phaeodactylibacter sp.]